MVYRYLGAQAPPRDSHVSHLLRSVKHHYRTRDTPRSRWRELTTGHLLYDIQVGAVCALPQQSPEFGKQVLGDCQQLFVLEHGKTIRMLGRERS